jgi:hypothetical protein
MAPAGVEGKDSYMTWKQAECSLLRSWVQIESQAARRAFSMLEVRRHTEKSRRRVALRSDMGMCRGQAPPGS